MPVNEQTYQQVALEDPEGQWELHCGRLVRKPDMTTEHNLLVRVLGHMLQSQLPLNEYVVGVDNSKLRRPAGRYLRPGHK